MKKRFPEKDHFNVERTILRVFSAFVKLGTVISILTLAFSYREALIMLSSYIFLWAAVYHPLIIRFQRKCVLRNIETILKQCFPDVNYLKKPKADCQLIDKSRILPPINKKSFIAREQITWKTNHYNWKSFDINYFTDKLQQYPADTFSGMFVQITLNHATEYDFIVKRKLSSQGTGVAKPAALSQIFSIQGNLNGKLPENIERTLLKLAAQTSECISLSVARDEVFIALAGDYFKSSYKLSQPITGETFSVPPIPRLKELEEIVCALL